MSVLSSHRARPAAAWFLLVIIISRVAHPPPRQRLSLLQIASSSLRWLPARCCERQPVDRRERRK